LRLYDDRRGTPLRSARPAVRGGPGHLGGDPSMQRILRALLAASALTTLAASAQQPAVEVTLARLDCGTGFNDQRRFSDTFAYSEPRVPFTFSCYVIKH